MASFLLVSFVLGLRLLQLSRRTQEVPELAMGLAFLLCGGLGYGQIAAAHGLWESRPHLTPIFLASGYLMVNLGAICLLLFTYGVFRRGQLLGRLVLFGLAATLLVAFTGSAFHAGFAEPRLTGGFAWLSIVGLGGSFVWTAAESLRYWAMLRRRERFGLADPLLADTFFWWGMGAASASVIFLVFAGLVWLDVQDVTHPAAAVPTALLGSFAALSIARAFRPFRRGVGRAARVRTPQPPESPESPEVPEVPEVPEGPGSPESPESPGSPDA
jgi:hypothetical protein